MRMTKLRHCQPMYTVSRFTYLLTYLMPVWCRAGSFFDQERCLVVWRDDVGGPDVRTRDAAVVPHRRRGGRQLRALVPGHGGVRAGVRAGTGGRTRPAGAVSARDLRPAARVLAARRGEAADVPRSPHVPPPKELRLQPA